jgi:KUP system potassium uptake protein
VPFVSLDRPAPSCCNAPLCSWPQWRGLPNWLLLFAVILLVLLFKTSSALAAAYGIAVTGDMVITSCLLFIVAWKFWRWPPVVAIMVIAPFLLIEIVFLSANALKIPQGGWFPLLLGTGLFILMRTWRKGSRLLAEISRKGRPPLLDFIKMCETGSAPRVSGTAMFLTGNASDVPAALLHNLKHNKVLHEKNVILTIVTEEVPRVPASQRVTEEKLSTAFSRVILRFGFMESPNVPQALREAGMDSEEVSFFLSRRVLVPSADSGLPLWQDHVYISLARAASDASDHFCIPEDRAVEVGSRISI